MNTLTQFVKCLESSVGLRRVRVVVVLLLEFLKGHIVSSLNGNQETERSHIPLRLPCCPYILTPLTSSSSSLPLPHSGTLR